MIILEDIFERANNLRHKVRVHDVLRNIGFQEIVEAVKSLIFSPPHFPLGKIIFLFG